MNGSTEIILSNQTTQAQITSSCINVLLASNSVSETIIGVPGGNGPTGAAGQDGAAGAQGPQGNPGPKGDTGSQGVQGLPGPQGVQGDLGPQGSQGVAGPAGADGINGTGAVNSVNGAAGDVTIPLRELLTASRIYYVRVDGLDSNDGLANTAAGAFASLQKALDVVGALDTVIYNVTVKLGPGTYIAAAGRHTIKSPLGTGTITIEGDTAAPANVVISASTHCFYYVNSTRSVALKGFKLIGTGTGIGAINAPVTFGFFEFANTGPHLNASSKGSIVAFGNYEISASTSRHAWASGQARISITGRTVTLTGTPGFAFFLQGTILSVISAYSMSYVGAATGQRYNLNGNSVLEIYGNAPAGSTNGSASSGAVVV